MSLNPDYYTQQLKEIQQELREDSSFHYGCKRFYRIVGILKRRPEMLSSERLVNICKKTNDEIFKKKHGSSFSIVYGLIWFILLLGFGVTVLFFSQTSGTITFFFTFNPSVEFFIDNIVMGFKGGIEQERLRDIFKIQTTLELDRTMIYREHIPMLASLGMYLIILHHQDASAAAATAGAATS